MQPSIFKNSALWVSIVSEGLRISSEVYNHQYVKKGVCVRELELNGKIIIALKEINGGVSSKIDGKRDSRMTIDH